MNAEQAELCARVLSSIAWCDGELAEEEMSRVVDLVCQLDYVDRGKLQEILMMPCNFVWMEKIQALPRKAQLRLLHDGYLVADRSGRIGQAECNILKQIAGTVAEGKPWSEVEACLRAYADYERRCRGLWGITHLA